MNITKRFVGPVLLGTALWLNAGGFAVAQQTAGQDLKSAGHDATDAVKDTGKGIKKGTVKAYDATKDKTEDVVDKSKHDTKKAYHKSKHTTKKAVHKSAEATSHTANKVANKTKTTGQEATTPKYQSTSPQ